MWSCEQKSSGPIVHVLNGDYPEADVRRMTLTGLEALVATLVRYTAGDAKPKWWPRGLVFGSPLDLDEPALKRLIADCCRFFRERWSRDENGAPRRRRRRVPAPLKTDPAKSQFLRYFRLDAKRDKEAPETPPPVAPYAAKLTNCVHIPFSSDVGRIMAAREHHAMSEDLKMKRLEKSEWYTNKGASRGGDVEYENGAYKVPSYCHHYKMPKRQFHQKRRSLHDPEFLLQFCNPLVVNVVRLDLDKAKKAQKKLVVMIDKAEKLCCDVKNKKKRTSPRFKKYTNISGQVRQQPNLTTN